MPILRNSYILPGILNFRHTEELHNVFNLKMIPLYLKPVTITRARRHDFEEFFELNEQSI